MNSLNFKTEEEKQEYVAHISGLIQPLRDAMNTLEEARANGEDLDLVLKKAEDLSTMVYVANNFYQAVRDKYREENVMLTYGQERKIVDCLHNTAAHVRNSGQYEWVEGAWYNLEPWDMRSGEVLKREFIKELRNLDLDQPTVEIIKKQPKVKK